MCFEKIYKIWYKIKYFDKTFTDVLIHVYAMIYGVSNGLMDLILNTRNNLLCKTVSVILGKSQICTKLNIIM